MNIPIAVLHKRSTPHNDRYINYLKGLLAEFLAAAILILKGYQILQHRARNSAGEIDLIAKRGKRLAFVEVKYRADMALAEAALSVRQQQRLKRAASSWVGKRPCYHDHEIGMDALLVCPWHWPKHHINAFS